MYLGDISLRYMKLSNPAYLALPSELSSASGWPTARGKRESSRDRSKREEMTA